MISGINKTINMNASSVINSEIVLFMYATIQTNGSFNINENITNKTLYFENEKEVRDDIAAFRAAVESVAKEYN